MDVAQQEDPRAGGLDGGKFQIGVAGGRRSTSQPEGFQVAGGALEFDPQRSARVDERRLARGNPTRYDGRRQQQLAHDLAILARPRISWHAEPCSGVATFATAHVVQAIVFRRLPYSFA